MIALESTQFEFFGTNTYLQPTWKMIKKTKYENHAYINAGE